MSETITIRSTRFACPRCGDRCFAVGHVHIATCRICGLPLWSDQFGEGIATVMGPTSPPPESTPPSLPPSASA